MRIITFALLNLLTLSVFAQTAPPREPHPDRTNPVYREPKVEITDGADDFKDELAIGSNVDIIADFTGVSITGGIVNQYSFDGVTVTFNGVPALITYISPQYCGVITPEIEEGEASIRITFPDGRSTVRSRMVRRLSPAIYHDGYLPLTPLGVAFAAIGQTIIRHVDVVKDQPIGVNQGEDLVIQMACSGTKGNEIALMEFTSYGGKTVLGVGFLSDTLVGIPGFQSVIFSVPGTLSGKVKIRMRVGEKWSSNYVVVNVKQPQ